jgi:N utilization substance protein A
MLRRLLEFEVPEIYNGQVEIKSIAREAGYRSKVAVAALQEGIDPVGACVGMRGVRIQNIVKELHEEKIDVIEWNSNSEIFIAKALSPARVSGVYLEEDPDTGRTAVVIVPDDQLSLAIGREGQNARLAAKLTGWRIDIKSVTEAVQEALENLDKPPLKDLQRQNGDMIAEVQRIVEKRAANRAVMPEEFATLGRFADIAHRRHMATREQARQTRLAEINAIKKTLPPRMFQMPIESLDLPDNILEVLQPLGNIGEIMWRFLMDEGRLRGMLTGLPPDSMPLLQSALERLVVPEDEILPEGEEALAAEAVAEAAGDAQAEPRDAFADTQEEGLPGDAGKPGARKEFRPVAVEAVAFDDDEEVDLSQPGKGKKKGKNKGRQLVFDEKSGGMVVKRQRKGNRGRDRTWNDWEE